MFGRSAVVTAQTGDYSFAQISGTVGSGQLPAAGGDLTGGLSAPTVIRLQGRPVTSTLPSMGQVLAWNGSTWTPQTQGGGVTSTFGRTGVVTAQTGDYSFTQILGTVSSGQLPSAGGDISGPLTNATVGKLLSRPLSATPPGTGQVLTYDGSQWLAQTPTTGGGGVNSVDKTIANTYWAGAKQTFVDRKSVV